MTRMELKIFKIDESKYMLNASSPKFDESLILDSEIDAEKTAKFIQKIQVSDTEFDVYSGEIEGSPAIVAVGDKKFAYVLKTENENIAAALALFLKAIRGVGLNDKNGRT